MGKGGIAALALLVIGFVVLIFVELASDPGGTSRSATKPNVDDVSTDIQPTGPRAKEPQLRPPVQITSTDTSGQLAPAKMERKMAQQMPKELYTMASECYGGELGKHEGIDVSYTVTFKNGVGRISNVRKLSSDLPDPELERCILEKLPGQTFADPEAPDITTDMSLRLTLLGLRKYNTPFGANPNELTNPSESETFDGDTIPLAPEAP